MANKIEKLALKTAELTRQTHELGIPVMILFEGVPASGKHDFQMNYYSILMPNIHFIATQSPQKDDLRYQFYKNIGIHYLKR